jgi:hypothetical protein
LEDGVNAQGVGRDLKKKFHDAAAGAVHVGESVTINQRGNGRGLGGVLKDEPEVIRGFKPFKKAHDVGMGQ